MKSKLNLFAAALLLASAGSALAAVRYVDVNSTNATPPYTTWATAATNIQHAVDAAVAGDEIVVTNGIYASGGRAVDGTTNRVAVNKPLTLRSVNGPQVTTIDGGRSVRCVYLTDSASISGFTLTKGSARFGGGVWCELRNEPTNAVISNCTLAGNFAEIAGGGAYGGTLNNCTLTGNGAFESDPPPSFGEGGGAYHCALNNCTLVDNFADVAGGGAFGCAMNNCIAYFNTAPQGANYSGTLNYCCTTPMPTDGLGNITNEPAFVNPAAGNFRLRADSPCIDAGTNLSASITNDLDGRPRPLDGNGDGLAAFDMGAYEYRTPLLVWQDSPNPTAPHADWATAAHTIQDAVDAAAAGDEIVVTNGIYATGERIGNRVTVDKPLSLRSVNGPQFTTIDGGHSGRCVYLTDGASLFGFALIYGLGSNRGGGVYGGTLNNCWLSGNSCYRGTAQYPAPQSYGGGAYGSTLNNCTLSGNSASHGGGAAGCTLNNCTLTGNRAFGAFDLSNGPGRGGGADYSTLNNCTIIGNGGSANNYGGGVSGSTLYNCIIYSNNAAFGENHYSSTLNHSCTTPLPANGFGNITNAPLFVDFASGNLRLQSNSPCINAGLNAFAPDDPDLDGNPRIAGGMGGTVDIGAYEFQLPTSIISYAWLQQYALPTDGSADTTDPDGDRFDNYSEWRAGSNPTSALSFLRLLPPLPLGPDLAVTWESVPDHTYVLEGTADLAPASNLSPPFGEPAPERRLKGNVTRTPLFTVLATNLPAASGTNTTTFTHTNAAGSGPWFYRVVVE